MKRTLWLTLPIVILVTVLGFNAGQRLASAHLLPDKLPVLIETPFPENAGEAQQETTLPALSGSVEEQISQALDKAVIERLESKSLDVPALLMYGMDVDQVFLSPDGQEALLWLALVDPETGERLETEPGLAVAQLKAAPGADAAKGPSSWDIVFPSEERFGAAVADLPAELITEPARELLEEQAAFALEKTPGQVFGGYKLPWAAGVSHRLTQSVSHIATSCTNLPSCVHAYDFADSTNSGMWPILAAKGGTVKDFRVTCSNGDTACTNFILLEDRSTDPVTYQLYYHMAKETVPPALRVIGTTVLQGQFIGNVDDTGYSTGHHLHFHVYTAFNQRVFFSNIVPITFDDVTVNVNATTGGGQPRLCWENTSYPQYGSQCSPDARYTSSNAGAFPPTGSLSAPAPGYVLDMPVLHVEGTASDDLGVTRAQLLVRNGSTWNEVGAALSVTDGRVSGDVDMCSGGAPSGPIEIALRLWDKEGNQTMDFPGRRTITNNNRCAAEASILSPGPLESLNAGTFTVTAQATSPAGITSVTVLARQNGAWSAIPARLSGSSYSATVDACSLGFSTGPVTLALQVVDKQNNTMADLPGLRTVSLNASCPTPPAVCKPAADQAAIFAQPNYAGACKLLNKGSYSGAALAAVGDDNIESVLLGANAYLTLFDGSGQTGRSESFEGSEPNLVDNILRGNMASSLVVDTMPADPSNRTHFPDPAVPAPLSPAVALGRAVTSADSLVLTWTGGAGASQFQGRLHRQEDADASKDMVMFWGAQNAFPVGSLRTGTYTWSVMGSKRLHTTYERRSTSGTVSFSVGSGAQTGGAALAAPLIDDLNSNTGRWAASGRWRFSTALPDGRAGWAFNNGTDYAGSITSGDLTSPPILLPAGASYLSFTYLTDTEANDRFWDRRVVQVGVDGGVFQDVYQLTEDPSGTWLNSAAIDLSPFAGHVVRIRFHFDALDGLYNSGLKGWMIDQVQLTAGAALAPCGEASPNNTFASATSLAPGASAPGSICPNGDIDIYRLTAAASGRIGISVRTDPSSELDPYLSVYDGAGRLLLEMDDLVPGQFRDPFLSLDASAGASYYLRVRAWNHPSAGGANYPYTISAVPDSGVPQVQLVSPLEIPSAGSVVVQAAADANLVVLNVYWHNQDWNGGTWQLMGSDTNGADGWAVSSDKLPAGQVGGLYVEAINAAGARSVDVLAGYSSGSMGYRVFAPNVHR